MTKRMRLDSFAPLPPETSRVAAPLNGTEKAQHDAAATFGIPDGIFGQPEPADPPLGFTIGDPPGETDDEAVGRLAKLPVLDYERVRIEEAERIGCRASVLDQLVAQARGDKGSASGRGVALYDAEPWPSGVDLGELLTDTAAAIRRHVVLPDASRDVVALWTAHTWVYEKFDHSPRLGITSPLRRCGKSTLIDVLRIMSRRTLKADSISASGVFRTVEALRPLSLLIDEADSFLKDNEELRGVLNSGFERSGQVIRVIERREEFVPVAFATYCHTVLASIGELPSTLADRAIPIRLQRKAVTEKTEKLRHAGNKTALAELARKFSRWSANSSKSLSTDAEVPEALGDREGDICIPLLAIADQAGGKWPARARSALVNLFGLRAQAEDNLELGALLLGDIRLIFGDSEQSMFSADICKRLTVMEDRPWPEWRQGKPITVTQLARAVQPFGLRPTTVRIATNIAKGYYKKAFKEAWSRYLPSTSTPTSPEGRGFEPLQRYAPRERPDSAENGAVTQSGCNGLENTLKPAETVACNGLTAQNAAVSDDGVSAAPDEVVI
jgi:putative DNA primase/helicase